MTHSVELKICHWASLLNVFNDIYMKKRCIGFLDSHPASSAEHMAALGRPGIGDTFTLVFLFFFFFFKQNFYKTELNKEEMYIRYIHKLYDLHLKAQNFTGKPVFGLRAGKGRAPGS